MGNHKPSLHSNDKEGFIRAFTDEWKELELEYHGLVNFDVDRSGRKGVLRLTTRLVRPSDAGEDVVAALYSCEYPTAAVESFEACLFRCLIQLGRILQARYAYPLGKA